MKKKDPFFWPLCAAHKSELKKSLEVRGLHCRELTAEQMSEAAAAMSRGIQTVGHPTAESFEPYFVAWTWIRGAAFLALGTGPLLFRTLECPACLMKEKCECSDPECPIGNAIRPAAEEAYDVAVLVGIVASS